MQGSDQQQTVAVASTDSDLELKSLLQLLIRRRWIILGVALPIIIVSSFVTLRATDKTVASARLMLSGRQPETPDFVSGSYNWDLEMSSASQVVMSHPVAKIAAEALVDTLQVLASENPVFPSFESVEDILNTFGGEIECDQVGESNILNVTYAHINSQFALVVVGAVIDAYMDFNVESQKNLPAVDYYNDQIRTLHARIDSLFGARVEIMKQAGTQAMAGNVTVLLTQIREWESKSLSLKSERSALEARIESVNHAIRKDPYFMPTSTEFAVSQTLIDHADRLRADLADLRSQLKPGSGHITVKERQLAEIWKEISRERDEYLEDLQIQVDVLKRQEQDYIESIISQEAAVADYPDVERQIEILDMQITAQLGLLKAMEMKRGEVQLKAGADLRVSNIVPLDEPFITQSLVGSRKSIYLLTAAILAVILGVISGWFVDNQDHRIYDRSQAINSLEIPVLGAISREVPDEGS